MKKNYLILILLLIGTRSISQFNSANLQAAGLTCAMCSKAINKSLEKLAFVEKVTADIKTSSFDIVFKKETMVDFDAIKKAVIDAGFSVAKLKITGIFSSTAIQNEKHIQLNGKTFHFLNITNQILDGEKTLVITDRDFLSAKEFKKYSATTKMTCQQTGKAGSCCIKDGIEKDTRIFHVTI